MHVDDYLASILPTKVAHSLGEGLGIHTVEDLIYHFPRRYIQGRMVFDPSTTTDGDSVMVRGRVIRADLSRMRQRKGYILRVTVISGDTPINVAFFHPHGIARVLTEGTEVLLDGTIQRRGRFFDMSHPNFLVLRKNAPAIAGGQFAKLLHATKIVGSTAVNTPTATSAELTSEDLHKDGLTGVDPTIIELLNRPIIPVYAAASGVSSWLLMVLIEKILPQVAPFPEVLPQELLDRHHLIPLDTALRTIHTPTTSADIIAAQERLRYDEAASLQMALLQQQQERHAHQAPACPPHSEGLVTALQQRLPYRLTAGQEKVLAEISTDISQPHPMNRLLQGEVGSGKTIVALLSMLQAVDNGYQAVLMAPTEVLAYQHACSIRELLGELGTADQLTFTDSANSADSAQQSTAPTPQTAVTLLTGSLSTAAKRQALLDIMTGQAGIIIGTQALLQEGVEFFRLGLVIIDEQHRFGVRQREILSHKGPADSTPHTLVMTATPIPRTIALTSFGDLTISTLKDLPRGRAPITTTVINTNMHPTWVPRIWQRICEEVHQGHQAYVVCPAIDDSDNSDLATVTRTYNDLTAGPLAGLRVGLLHGRLSTDEKTAVMDSFSSHECDVLVCTTVIEVGIDVPNATMMVVVDADRFGVSQLHQLRGRVGRGNAPGLCLLLTDCDPASSAEKRLTAVEASTDGFYLARGDLAQRREGNLLGTTQAGLTMPLRVLDIAHDEDVVADARDDMEELLKNSSSEWSTQYPGWANVVAKVASQSGVYYPHG